jgi:hypothetical protein
MSDEDFGFGLPPFKPEDALQTIKRTLRDLKLAERGTGFELRGKRVLEISAEADALQVRIARKLALTPEWDRLSVRNAGEQRKFIDEIKKRLARWAQDD